MSSERPLKVLVYSDDRTTRESVRLALGKRPAADLPTLEYVECATEPAVIKTMDKGGMSTMAPLARVEIPANTDVAFAPGGRHVMLFDMNSGIKPSDRVTLTFAFADGTRIINNATVVAAGTPVGK